MLSEARKFSKETEPTENSFIREMEQANQENKDILKNGGKLEDKR
jgi:hypothetical protein